MIWKIQLFSLGRKKGVLSLLQKDTQIPMRVTRNKQLRTHNKESTNAKSLQQISTLTRKYMRHSILRSLFESFVRVSLPSSPRARADCLFFSKNSRELCVAADWKKTGGFEFLRRQWISLSLTLSTMEEFNLTHHPRQIPSLSRVEEFYFCLRSRFTSKAVCLYEAFSFFLIHPESLQKVLVRFLIRSLLLRDIFWFDFSPLFWSKIREGKKNKIKNTIKRHTY